MNLILRATTIALTAFFLAGCATPRINWQARVGIYTYDQAVMDFGPPNRMAKLSDGSTVAEWQTERGEMIVTREPYFYGPGYFAPMGPNYSTTYFPARWLRLTFGSDGKLKAWKEFSK